MTFSLTSDFFGKIIKGLTALGVILDYRRTVLRKGISLCAGFIFIFWLIPLGRFIPIEREEKVCNGQRAICLCRHLIAKRVSTDSPMSSVQIRTAGAPENSGLSSPPYDSISRVGLSSLLNFARMVDRQQYLCLDDVLRLPDPVPRPPRFS